MALPFDTFTGGIFDTNCFFLPETGILIDAPQDAAEWLQQAGHQVKLLLLTHGHVDHTWDAARIQRTHGCRIGCHEETVPMITEAGFFRKLGFHWDVETVTVDVIDQLGEGPGQIIGGMACDVFLIPGHCPGSLCFLQQETQMLFGGDVLFAGGVGRWDLPGGDRDLLFAGIRQKLWPLEGAIRVLPGHGPATTIGQERQTNPFVGEDAEGF